MLFINLHLSGLLRPPLYNQKGYYERDPTCFNKAPLDIGRLFHIFPKFLNFKLRKEESQGDRACHWFKEDLLNYELNQKFSVCYKFKRSYGSAQSLSPLEYNHVCSVIETKASKIKEPSSHQHKKKFNNLKHKFGIPIVSMLNNDDIILYYSYRVLTKAWKSALASGFCFCLLPKVLINVMLNAPLYCFIMMLLV